VNPFAGEGAGERYARGRPQVHTRVASAIAERCGPIARALDLGCGTGLSSRALRSHASRVVGVDPSRSMLAQAKRDGVVSLVRRHAEAIPLAAASVDLVAIGCAFHWCEREPLLAGVARVLRPGGRFAIYDSLFLGDESGAMLRWLRDHYWKRLPECPRQPYLSPGDPLPKPLRFEAWLEVGESAPMSLDDVVALVTSQASTLQAIDLGVLDLDTAEATLRAGLAPHFAAAERRPMHFRSPLAILLRE
jgi:SAM-dependent methyltransferase